MTKVKSQPPLFPEEDDVPARRESTHEGMDAPPGASPFVKWAGGKRNLRDALMLKVPEVFGTYYEPFVGGGALFFELVRRQRLSDACLSDSNLELMLAYSVIQKEPAALIEKLKAHAAKHGSEYYYQVRARTEWEEAVAIAARFIYLNKTGYNGLYRVNSKGEFNVPIGRYKNPGIVQEENLWACHKALKNAGIHYTEFDTIAPRRGDFVYFDPPYHPTDEASFTKYSKLDFTEQDQARLRDFALKLHKKGVKVMLSNSNTRFIQDLYKSKAFNIAIVQAPRFVNCKADKRHAVDEVLITNY